MGDKISLHVTDRSVVPCAILARNLSRMGAYHRRGYGQAWLTDWPHALPQERDFEAKMKAQYGQRAEIVVTVGAESVTVYARQLVELLTVFADESAHFSIVKGGKKDQHPGSWLRVRFSNVGNPGLISISWFKDRNQPCKVTYNPVGIH